MKLAVLPGIALGLAHLLGATGMQAQQLNVDRIHINGGSSGGYIEMVERSSPPATPSGVNQCVIYCEDNGSGKTRIVVKWGAGTTTVIATQP